MIVKDASGQLVRKSGIMGIVLKGGAVSINDEIVVKRPPKPFQKLEPV